MNVVEKSDNKYNNPSYLTAAGFLHNDRFTKHKLQNTKALAHNLWHVWHEWWAYDFTRWYGDFDLTSLDADYIPNDHHNPYDIYRQDPNYIIWYLSNIWSTSPQYYECESKYKSINNIYKFTSKFSNLTPKIITKSLTEKKLNINKNNVTEAGIHKINSIIHRICMNYYFRNPKAWNFFIYRLKERWLWDVIHHDSSWIHKWEKKNIKIQRIKFDSDSKKWTEQFIRFFQIITNIDNNSLEITKWVGKNFVTSGLFGLVWHKILRAMCFDEAEWFKNRWDILLDIANNMIWSISKSRMEIQSSKQLHEWQNINYYINHNFIFDKSKYTLFARTKDEESADINLRTNPLADYKTHNNDNFAYTICAKNHNDLSKIISKIFDIIKSNYDIEYDSIIWRDKWIFEKLNPEIQSKLSSIIKSRSKNSITSDLYRDFKLVIPIICKWIKVNFELKFMTYSDYDNAQIHPDVWHDIYKMLHSIMSISREETIVIPNTVYKYFKKIISWEYKWVNYIQKFRPDKTIEEILDIYLDRFLGKNWKSIFTPISFDHNNFQNIWFVYDLYLQRHTKNNFMPPHQIIPKEEAKQYLKQYILQKLEKSNWSKIHKTKAKKTRN